MLIKMFFPSTKTFRLETHPRFNLWRRCSMLQAKLFFDISKWDTSNVISMWAMFNQATNINSDLSCWNTSKVEDMPFMFWQATHFHGDISRWDTSRVVYMNGMLAEATNFNIDIFNVDDMRYMFSSVISFNVDISSINVVICLMAHTNLNPCCVGIELYYLIMVCLSLMEAKDSSPLVDRSLYPGLFNFFAESIILQLEMSSMHGVPKLHRALICVH